MEEIFKSQLDSIGLENVGLLFPASHTSYTRDFRLTRLFPYGRTGRNFLSLLALYFALRSATLAFRPTIIHAHSSFAGLIVRLVYRNKKRRPAIVYCPHGWAFDRLSGHNFVVAAIEKFLSRWTDSIICISQHEYDCAIKVGLPPDRLELVVSGIDIEPPVSKAIIWRESSLKILYVGRLDRQKGYDILLDALDDLNSRGKKFSAKIIGEYVVDSDRDSKKVPNVEKLGWRTRAEVSAHMSAADVLVVPSRWEGFGLVALEAMRVGCPVICSNTGGLSEIVKDGVTGRHFPVGASSRLAEILFALDAETLDAWGTQSRARFLEYYSSIFMNSKTLALYQKLLSLRISKSATIESKT